MADAGGDAVASVTYEVYAGPTTGTMTAQTLGSPTDTFFSKAGDEEIRSMDAHGTPIDVRCHLMMICLMFGK